MSWQISNHVVPMTDSWSTLRVPLVRWLDGEGLPFEATDGTHELVLTLLPLTPGRTRSVEGIFALSWVALEGAP